MKEANGHDIEERFRVVLEMVVEPRTIIIVRGILASYSGFVIIKPRAECSSR